MHIFNISRFDTRCKMHVLVVPLEPLSYSTATRKKKKRKTKSIAEETTHLKRAVTDQRSLHLGMFEWTFVRNVFSLLVYFGADQNKSLSFSCIVQLKNLTHVLFFYEVKKKLS